MERLADRVILVWGFKRSLLAVFAGAFAVLALSLPLSGYWLVDTAGWPLGQTWLLLGSILYGVMMLIGLLLAGRLAAWRALGDAPAPTALKRLCLIYAGLILVFLIAIMALMGAKPA